MNKKMIAAALAAMALAGCAAQKVMVPMGGSRNDGTVKMSYTYSAQEKAKVDMDASTDAAKKRCNAWGYKGAEPFGGQTKACSQQGPNSCEAWTVTMEFQCTGTPPAK